MEHLLTITLVLVAAIGMFAQWLAWRLRVPAIVFLLLAGIIVGPLTGWISPSADLGPLLRPLVSLGVAVILFEGGLNLHFHELKQAAAGVKRLATAGVLLSLVLGAVAAHAMVGMDWPVAVIFGAIIVVTGPTVIIPLLRQARLRRRPASFLKWEGIINDPIGALLAVIAFEYFVHSGETGVSGVVARLGLGLGAATLLGIGGGFLLGSVYRRGLVPEYLKGPGALVAALAVYALANAVLSEAGLLATTILGIVLGNLGLPSIAEIRRFKEYIAIVLVSGVFILLTADLDPATLLALDWRSVALLAIIMFVVRPLAIFASTPGAGMTWPERSLLAWIAPRGVVAAAVAGVFAPQLEQQGYAGAALLLPVVFALILTTVVLHGLSIGWLARRLGLSAAGSQGVLIVGASAWTVALARALKGAEVPVTIVDTSWHRLRSARFESIPVYYGEILSELSEQTMEFGEYTHVFAATDNDAYNSLVCRRFAPELGQHNVYQLPYPLSDEADPKQFARGMRGTIAPDDKMLFEDLVAHTYRGWTFQKTTLTETFTYDDCLAACPEESIPVVLIEAAGDVHFNSPERPLKPKAEDVLIWFGPRRERAKKDRPQNAETDRETAVTA